MPGEAIGGVKGTNNYGYSYISALASAALLLNGSSSAQMALIEPLTNTLPYNRSTGKFLSDDSLS